MLHFWWTLIVDAIRLDTVGLIPNSSHPPLHPNLVLDGTVGKNRGGGFFRILDFFRAAAREFVYRGPSTPDAESQAVYFFALSTNQLAALEPIAVELSKRTRTQIWTRDDLGRLRARAFPLALPFFPVLIYRWLRSSGYGRRSFAWSLDDYWLNYGFYISLRLWFRRARPIAAVVSNDHVQYSTVLAAAAMAERIPTFYVQHACVTYAFPPLRTDFALLDGVDALEKYDAAGPSATTAYLVGIGKFDAYLGKVRTSTELRKIGVCFSMADNPDRSEQLLRGIADVVQHKLEVVVRPHPRMRASYLASIQALAAELAFTWSDPQYEPSFDFLCALDAIVCGVSAIALEAAMVNVVPLNFVLNEEHTDWYGFIEHGLCRSTADIGELQEWLHDMMLNGTDAIRDSVRRYSATIDTPWDGRSSELAARVIFANTSDNGGHLEELYPIETSQLEAYSFFPPTSRFKVEQR